MPTRTSANRISDRVIDRLVEIGRLEAFAELEEIAKAFPNGGFMRMTSGRAEYVRGLPEDSIIALVKALTLLENYPGFQTGSVSPIIRFFRDLPDHMARVELIDWVLSRTDNHYVPFGSSNHDAKNLDKYYERCANNIARRSAALAEEQSRQDKAKLRKQREATQRLFGAIRRKDAKAVQALLAKGADCNVANESGQTALQFAESIGLGHLLAGAKPERPSPQ